MKPLADRRATRLAAFPRTAAGIVLAAVALAVGLGACGGGEDRPGSSSSASASGTSAESVTKAQFDEKDATSTIPVTLQDYAFVGLPTTTKGPNVLFEAKVVGGNEHELRVETNDGKFVGEIPPFKAGPTKKLALKLQPGTYVVNCLVSEGNKTHEQLGMRAELVVE